jgi:VWFA-related protein
MTLKVSSVLGIGFSAALACVLAPWVTPGRAQSTSAPQSGAPHFTSQASLVLIPTVVTDRTGAQVTGLTKDDFYVLDNKQPQKISIFEEVKTAPGVIRRVDPHDNGFTNAVAPEAKNQRLTMILLDTLNTQFSDQVRARRELLKVVEEALQPDEPVALLTIGSSGLTVLNDFTTDPKVLAAAVKKVRAQASTAERNADEQADLEMTLQQQQQSGQAPITEDMIADELNGFQGGAFERFQQLQLANGIEVTLRALRQIAESFSGVPGRKSLIWVTGGLPFVPDDPSAFEFGSAELLARYESTWNALNDAQITVYPLDMGGLFNPGFISPRFRRVIRYRRAVDSVSNVETLAKMTGGKFCEYKMSLSGCYKDAQKDAGHYYLIGYYTDITKGKTGWRKLDVTVARPQVQVRARSSYYIPSKPPDPLKAEREDMNTAIVSPADFTAVPILVRWTERSADGTKVKLNFRINVASAGITLDENTHRISVVFGAFAKTAKGGIAGDFAKELDGVLPAATAEQIAAHGVVYDGAITIPPGKYIVRFVVRDNPSGRLGTVSVPVDAEQVAAPK